MAFLRQAGAGAAPSPGIAGEDDPQTGTAGAEESKKGGDGGGGDDGGGGCMGSVDDILGRFSAEQKARLTEVLGHNGKKEKF